MNDYDSEKKVVTYMIYVLIETCNNRNTKNLNGELQLTIIFEKHPTKYVFIYQGTQQPIPQLMQNDD